MKLTLSVLLLCISCCLISVNNARKGTNGDSNEVKNEKEQSNEASMKQNEPIKRIDRQLKRNKRRQIPEIRKPIKKQKSRINKQKANKIRRRRMQKKSKTQHKRNRKKNRAGHNKGRRNGKNRYQQKGKGKKNRTGRNKGRKNGSRKNQIYTQWPVGPVGGVWPVTYPGDDIIAYGVSFKRCFDVHSNCIAKEGGGCLEDEYNLKDAAEFEHKVVTLKGLPCLSWSITRFKSYFDDPNQNACANPSRYTYGPWCYVGDTSHWDVCFPVCTPTEYAQLTCPQLQQLNMCDVNNNSPQLVTRLVNEARSKGCNVEVDTSSCIFLLGSGLLGGPG